jgi:hypothetical protein
MKKSDMFRRFKNVLLRSTLLPFLSSSEYKVFEIDILWDTSLTICGFFFRTFGIKNNKKIIKHIEQLSHSKP